MIVNLSVPTGLPEPTQGGRFSLAPGLRTHLAWWSRHRGWSSGSREGGWVINPKTSVTQFLHRVPFPKRFYSFQNSMKCYWTRGHHVQTIAQWKWHCVCWHHVQTILQWKWRCVCFRGDLEWPCCTHAYSFETLKHLCLEMKKIHMERKTSKPT